MAGKHAKDTPADEAPQQDRTSPGLHAAAGAEGGGIFRTDEAGLGDAGAEGVGARRSAEEAARLQDQDEAQRAAESGQD